MVEPSLPWRVIFVMSVLTLFDEICMIISFVFSLMSMARCNNMMRLMMHIFLWSNIPTPLLPTQNIRCHYLLLKAAIVAAASLAAPLRVSPHDSIMQIQCSAENTAERRRLQLTPHPYLVVSSKNGPNLLLPCHHEAIVVAIKMGCAWSAAVRA